MTVKGRAPLQNWKCAQVRRCAAAQVRTEMMHKKTRPEFLSTGLPVRKVPQYSGYNIGLENFGCVTCLYNVNGKMRLNTWHNVTGSIGTDNALFSGKALYKLSKFTFSENIVRFNVHFFGVKKCPLCDMCGPSHY